MIHKRLQTFINNEQNTRFTSYTPEGIEQLLEHFGSPHHKIKSVHIAGTNGKGSVACFLKNIFKKSGYSVGIYTSPHLLELNERIQINDVNISDEVLNVYLDELEEFIRVPDIIIPTFFDVMTFFAFRYFYESSVDIAVIECGLGGRLDSTNVLTPLLSIITDISLDHCSILGTTLYEIAQEKAGIIKRNVPIISMNEDDIVREVIKIKAEEMKSPLHVYPDDFYYKGGDISPVHLNFTYYSQTSGDGGIEIQLRDMPQWQMKNSSAAITAARILKESYDSITTDTIFSALKETIIQGRMEVLYQHPLIIFDPAHNIKAVSLLVEYLSEKYRGYAVTVFVSLMKDKSCNDILRILSQFSRTIYVKMNDSRTFVPDDTSLNYISQVIESDEDVKEVILREISQPHHLYLFTGTFRIYKNASEIAVCLKGNNT